MSAVWLKIVTVLCVSGTALSGPGRGGVVWRDLGEDVTIQCRHRDPDQEVLILKKGLNEELEVLYKDSSSEKNNIDDAFRDRLQLRGKFPDMEILIENLTSDDTGPYWCMYKKFDSKSLQTVITRGTGSVLLVVTDKCDPSSNTLILVCVVICAAVLVGVIIFFLIWIIRKNKRETTKKPRPVASNDVYEDMRGTIRR